ncbi:MAG TPA: dihydrofolate reductase [Bacteroidales bacterium]|nr:dihydrofolate reductase [Bacteroidales bacterium]HPR58806.1 dihydrofolate reductase [Bacteroidales bacterium]
MAFKEDFRVIAEQFDDYRILRYQVPGFEALPLKKKLLVYYLYEAALSGRDIIWDQNYRYNLLIRRMLGQIVSGFKGDRTTEDWKKFLLYVKKVWFSNGIHHHYSMEKLVPDFSQEYFRSLPASSEEITVPDEFSSLEAFTEYILLLIFDKHTDSKRVCLDEGTDLVAASANNFYEGVTQEEAGLYYERLIPDDKDRPVSYGLNSKLVKEGAALKEKVWRVGGMYSAAIERIVYWLEKAAKTAENEAQEAAFNKLIEFYRTGDLKKFDEYNILWLNDREPQVDAVNGFIEVYGDPLGRKATWESVVSVRDEEATRRTKIISENAQWFEDHAPIPPQYRKEAVTGVMAKAIHVVVEAGDCSPSSPVGINLPNADWIRAEHGSRSVVLINIMTAHNEASRESGVIEAFAWSDVQAERQRTHGNQSYLLHVDLHEIIGHGSGKLKPGTGNPADTLKNYASTIEEARADLFALYFATDPKLIELGLMPDQETGYAAYDNYITGGMMVQLAGIEPGKNLEESHMRNRQLIAAWAYEKGLPENVVEKKIRDGKTFFVINDYEKLRELFGKLLWEIQRIKSEGDYAAARKLVEDYGVRVDPVLHQEVLRRWKALNIARFSGFINPVLVPEYQNGEITDVTISYPEDFTLQMLDYDKKYAWLPVKN